MTTTLFRERLLAAAGALVILAISYLPLTYSPQEIRAATAAVYSATGIQPG